MECKCRAQFQVGRVAWSGLLLQQHHAKIGGAARARRLALTRAKTLRVVIPHDLLTRAAECLPCKKFKIPQQAPRDYDQEQIWGVAVAIVRAERHRKTEVVGSESDGCSWEECGEFWGRADFCGEPLVSLKRVRRA